MNDKKTTILIVDDTPANLDILFEHLRQENFKVLVAENGPSALERANYYKPDIILLDVMMPGIDGFETCRRFKADEATQDIPIIFLTALSDTIDKVQGFTVGGVDYITKPIQVAEVMARLNTHLTIRRLQNRLREHNEQLETRVQTRTIELATTNAALQAEISQRKQHQQEKDKLFDVVRQQGEQLRELTNWLIESQQHQRTGLAQDLHEQVAQNLTVLHHNLGLIRNLLATSAASPSTLLLAHLADALGLLERTQTYLQDVTTSLNQPHPADRQLQENPLLHLSAREREVLQLMVDGKSAPEIAAILYLSAKTVRTYQSRIRAKLDIHDVAGLVKFALKHKLTSLK